MKASKLFAFLLAGTLTLGCLAGPAYASNDIILETTPDLSALEGRILVPADSSETTVSVSDPLIAAINTDDAKEGAETYEKRVLYQTYNQEDDPTAHLPESITINGETYTLEKASDPVYVKKEVITPKTIQYNTEVFTENDEEHMPDEVMLDETGIQYRLVEKELTEQMQEERTEYKESVVTYNAVEAGVKIPDQKEIEVTDIDTNQVITAILDLKDAETVKSYWSDDFSFPITITGYDAEVFLLNGHEIPRDAELIRYADDFLAYLQLDPDSYKVSEIEWIGDPYEKDGAMVRDAQGKGSKYVNDIKATYSGDVTMPSITGYSWHCTYEEVIPENEREIISMATNVTYRQQAGTLENEKSWLQKLYDGTIGIITAAYEAVAKSFEEHPVITSIPVIALAALLAYLISKKIRNRCVYNNTIKCPYKKHTKDTCKGCVNYRNRNKV